MLEDRMRAVEDTAWGLCSGLCRRSHGGEESGGTDRAGCCGTSPKDCAPGRSKSREVTGRTWSIRVVGAAGKAEGRL